MLSRARWKCGKWLNDTYKTTHDHLIRQVQTKKMRIAGVIIGGTTFAEAVNYCISLLGTAGWLVAVNYVATAIGFVVAGTLGYVGFDLGINGLRQIRKNLRQVWGILHSLQHNQKIVTDNQTLQETEVYAQKNINKKLIEILQEISKSSNSPETQSKIGELESLISALETTLKTSNSLAPPPLMSPTEEKLQSPKGKLTELVERRNSSASPSLSSSPSVFFPRPLHPLMPEYRLDETQEEGLAPPLEVRLQHGL